MTTPPWQAARDDFPGNLDATNASAQVNQLLGTHGVTPIYQGSQIIAPAPGYAYHTFSWSTSLSTNDYDQSFTLPTGQTAVGRIAIPINVVGNGADLQVTLYPDNGSGVPNTNTPLASTVTPAAHIVALTAPTGLTTGGPLATATVTATVEQNNYTFPWGQPAIGANGAAYYATPVTSGSYIILMGGSDGTAASTPSNLVATVQNLGGPSMSGPLPQPSLPRAAFYGIGAATSSMVMFAGGTDSTNFFSDVHTASWNPLTGIIGSWTKQTSLPTALIQGSAATWGDYVYVTGGSTNGSASNAQGSVWWAQATNGQIQSWSSGPPLPQPLQVHYSAVIGNWLIVAGGQTSTGATSGATYYAPIHTDGSLGGWLTGPSMPTPVYALSAQWGMAVTDAALVVVSGLINGSTLSDQLQTLPVGASGIGSWWSQHYGYAQALQCCAFPHDVSSGTWQLIALETTDFLASQLAPAQMLSVPLPASGLTAGATYHVVIHQNGGDLSNYLQVALAPTGALPSYVYRPAWSSGSWTAFSGYEIPLSVFDQTASGTAWHSWEDPDSRYLATGAATFVSDYRGRLLGVCEATALPNNPLNSNDLTTASVSPWTATAGTITASTAETQGGYAYSGLLTPDGSNSTSWAQSEMLPVSQGEWYTAEGWLYSPPGYSGVSLSVMWWDHAGNFISSSNASITLAAATWTQVTNIFQAPTGAAQAALAPSEGGTPTAADLLYISAVTLTAAGPTTLASVAEIAYSGVWPLTGITQLA